MSKSEKGTALLNDWSILFHAYMPIIQLDGTVTKHDKLEDGSRVITSPLVNLNFDENTAETFNTYYTLGEPKKEWLEWLDRNGMDHSHIRSKRSMN